MGALAPSEDMAWYQMCGPSWRPCSNTSLLWDLVKGSPLLGLPHLPGKTWSLILGRLGTMAPRVTAGDMVSCPGPLATAVMVAGDGHLAGRAGQSAPGVDHSPLTRGLHRKDI